LDYIIKNRVFYRKELQMTTEKAKNTEKEQDAPLIALPSDDEGEGASGAPKEYGGRKKGLDATRYGDWEKDGRAIDF
jgi:hypothetical protein